MSVSTVDADGVPDSRMLVLKDLTADGTWCFAGRRDSTKGIELGTRGYVNPTWPLADGQKWTHLARAQRQSSAFRAPAQVPAKGASSWR